MFRFLATTTAISALTIVACSPQATPPKGEDRPAAQRETVLPPATAVQDVGPSAVKPVQESENNATDRKEDGKNPASIVKATSQGGLVVVVDPVTRQIREATPAEIATLGTLTPAPPVPGVANAPVYLSGPGGAVGIALGSESENYTIVTKTPDGKLQMEEVTGERAAAERVLSGARQKSANEK